MIEFVEFPKIARLSRECVITEKIDGTNAQIHIAKMDDYLKATDAIANSFDSYMFAGSRNRYIVPGADNFGFAGWVKAHADELWALGEGRHYGEWWGSGIQRGYGLTKGEKRFSLFNVGRWNVNNVPPCVSVVPTLYRGEFTTACVDAEIERLRMLGSVASSGFMQPEGVIVFHTASGQMFKKTLEKDEQPKGRAA